MRHVPSRKVCVMLLHRRSCRRCKAFSKTLTQCGTESLQGREGEVKSHVRAQQLKEGVSAVEVRSAPVPGGESLKCRYL